MELLNPWMLFGLAGLAIPVLVHLLSRRKQDLVDWGAMQFLEPSPRQRRSLWIENLWLMLLRMALLALLTLALTRPWFQSTWLARWTTNRPQDVALVVDGSYSLERIAGNRTLTDDVRRLARQVLDQLDGSDQVQVYDARESAQPRLPNFTSDRRATREALLDLPTPSGGSNLLAALTTAARDLLRTGNLDRDIVVVTDGQRYPWRVDDAAAWQMFDTLIQQAKVPPRIWVIEARQDGDPPPRNLSIGPIELSRELALPGGQIRLRAPIRSYGYDAPVTCEVQLAINGLRSPQHTASVRVPANGVASVEFDLRFDKSGAQALALSLDFEDDLPADNTTVAVVEIGGGWPILIIDGSPQRDPIRSETWFAMAALDAGVEGWLRPTLTTLDDWDIDTLADYAAIVLANVPALDDEQIAALKSFVSSGGGVLVTLGDEARPSDVDDPDDWTRWLGLTFKEIAGDPTDEAAATTVIAESLELPWQERFRRQRTGGFCDVRYRQWWRVALPPAGEAQAAGAAEAPRVAARFASGDPCLIWQRRDQGSVAVFTSTLDADWNALPSRPDYVAWWHEVLFALLEPASRRNVAVGEPLLARAPVGAEALSGRFLGPGPTDTPGEDWQLGTRPARRLPKPRMPGFYLFVSDPAPAADLPTEIRRHLAEGKSQVFAVQADINESDLAPLSNDDRARISAGRAIEFLPRVEQLETAWLGDAGRTEIAIPLLYLLLGFLVWETWLTRRLVQRGAGDAADDAAPSA